MCRCVYVCGGDLGGAKRGYGPGEDVRPSALSEWCVSETIIGFYDSYVG